MRFKSNKSKEAFSKDVAACKGDYYLSSILNYAIRWAEIMEQRIDEDGSISECAEEASYLADTDWITEIMFVKAVTVLISCWQYGAELCEWYEQYYLERYYCSDE